MKKQQIKKLKYLIKIKNKKVLKNLINEIYFHLAQKYIIQINQILKI